MLNVTCKKSPKNHPCGDFFPESCCEIFPIRIIGDPPKKRGGFCFWDSQGWFFWSPKKNPTVLQATRRAAQYELLRKEPWDRAASLWWISPPEGKGFGPQSITFSKEITWNYVKLHHGRLTAGSPTKWSSKPPWLCSMLIFRGVNMIKCMHVPEAFRLCFLPLKKIRGISLSCTCRQCI